MSATIMGQISRPGNEIQIMRMSTWLTSGLADWLAGWLPCHCPGAWTLQSILWQSFWQTTATTQSSYTLGSLDGPPSYLPISQIVHYEDGICMHCLRFNRVGKDTQWTDGWDNS